MNLGVFSVIVDIKLTLTAEEAAGVLGDAGFFTNIKSPTLKEKWASHWVSGALFQTHRIMNK